MYEVLLILALFVGAGVVTYWFLQGFLNPIIEASVGIFVTAAITIASFFLTPFIKMGKVIIKIIDRIPAFIKAISYIIIGCAVFIFDHYYNTKIFAEDETTFYKMGFMNKTFWVTEIALWIGGFLFFMAFIIILKQIFRLLDWLLNRQIQVVLTFQK